MKNVTIDYIKYTLHEDTHHATVCGFDQRKSNQSSIKIPSKVCYLDEIYYVKYFSLSLDGLFKTDELVLPNTITRIGYETVDITELAGRTETLDGKTIRVYEAREKPDIDKKSTSMARRFALSSTDRKIAGVCGGIASWLGVNSIIVRIIAFFTCGFFFWGYILLWIFMPRDDE